MKKITMMSTYQDLVNNVTKSKSGDQDIKVIHPTLNPRNWRASWTSERKEEDFGRNGRCLILGGAHPILNSRTGMVSWTS